MIRNGDEHDQCSISLNVEEYYVLLVIIVKPFLKYRIVQNFGGENFGKTNAICQYFTQIH